MIRHPHTYQERKQNQDGYGRAKRNKLPTDYDDLIRTDWNDKSWKSKRKQRYKVRPEVNAQKPDINEERE